MTDRKIEIALEFEAAEADRRRLSRPLSDKEARVAVARLEAMQDSHAAQLRAADDAERALEAALPPIPRRTVAGHDPAELSREELRDARKRGYL